MGDFNKDIVLMGRQNEYNTIPPQLEGYKWHVYTNKIYFMYITTNTHISQ